MKLKLTLILLILLAYSTPALAMDGRVVNDAITMYKRKQPAAAADMLKKYAEDLEYYSQDNYDISNAALIYVISSIAYDRSGSSQAAETWQLAEDLFSEIGTNWKEQKRIYNLRINNLSAAESSGSYKIKDEDALLLDLQKVFKFTNFNKPSASAYAARPANSRSASSRSANSRSDRRSSGRSASRSSRRERERAPSRPSRGGYHNDSPQYFARPRSNQDNQEDYDSSSRSISSRGIRYDRPSPTQQRSRDDFDYNDKRERYESNRRYQDLPPRGESRSQAQLSDGEVDVANEAWNYFVKNCDDETGLCPIANGKNFCSTKDIGLTIAAYISAYEIGLIGKSSFDIKIKKLLTTLATLQLYNREMFNSYYNVRSVYFTDQSGEEVSDGDGWNIADIGLTLAWLKRLGDKFPQHANSTENIVNRLDFGRALINDELNSMSSSSGRERLQQNIYLGYRDITVQALKDWRLIENDLAFKSKTSSEEINGIIVKYDANESANLTSTPFILARFVNQSMPYDLQNNLRSIFNVHLDNLRDGERVVTSAEIYDADGFTEYGIDKGQKSWDKEVPFNPAVAISFYSIFDDRQTKNYFEDSKVLSTKGNGFWEAVGSNGSINKNISLQNNSMILQALNYKNNY